MKRALKQAPTSPTSLRLSLGLGCLAEKFSQYPMWNLKVDNMAAGKCGLSINFEMSSIPSPSILQKPETAIFDTFLKKRPLKNSFNILWILPVIRESQSHPWDFLLSIYPGKARLNPGSKGAETWYDKVSIGFSSK